MKIQYMGSKKGNEKLLYEFETFLENFSITWPASSELYTKNYTLGSEFVRLTNLPEYSYVEEEEKGLLAFRSSFADVVVNIPGRDELFIKVLVDSTEKLSSQADLILDRLEEIKLSLEGGPQIWP